MHVWGRKTRPCGQEPILVGALTPVAVITHYTFVMFSNSVPIGEWLSQASGCYAGGSQHEHMAACTGAGEVRSHYFTWLRICVPPAISIPYETSNPSFTARANLPRRADPNYNEVVLRMFFNSTITQRTNSYLDWTRYILRHLVC